MLPNPQQNKRRTTSRSICRAAFAKRRTSVYIGRRVCGCAESTAAVYRTSTVSSAWPRPEFSSASVPAARWSPLTAAWAAWRRTGVTPTCAQV